MRDIDVINAFKETISWADETELRQHGDRTFLQADSHCYVPVRWDELDIAALSTLEAELATEVIVLVWGDPDHATASRIYLECAYTGLAATFIDVVARVAMSQTIMGCLDGIDWQRSLENIIKHGHEAKPIYEWDPDRDDD